MKKIYLITAWRTTGKDTLYKQLINISDIPWNWNLPKALFDTNIKRYAFADELKKYVANKLGIDSNMNFDEIKNKIYEGKTFRDHLIDDSKEIKKLDENYWCKKLFKKVEEDNFQGSIFITDWRFYHEYDYIKSLNKYEIITLRLYRSSVPIPSLELESEHNLDDYKTDYLLIDEESTLEDCLSKFPQYD